MGLSLTEYAKQLDASGAAGMPHDPETFFRREKKAVAPKLADPTLPKGLALSTPYADVDAIDEKGVLRRYLRSALETVRASEHDTLIASAWAGLMFIRVRPRFARSEWTPWVSGEGLNYKRVCKAMRDAEMLADGLGICTTAELLAMLNKCPHRWGGTKTLVEFETWRAELVAQAMQKAEERRVRNLPASEDFSDSEDEDTDAGDEAPAAQRNLPSSGDFFNALPLWKSAWQSRAEREGISAARRKRVENAFRVLEEEFGGPVRTGADANGSRKIGSGQVENLPHALAGGMGQGRAENAGQRVTDGGHRRTRTSR